MMDMYEEKNISPMLLNEIKEPFDDDNYIYELKLDGIRCVAYIDPNSVTLQNKRFKDLTEIYPELSDICKCVKKRIILDGELVFLTNGKPDFYALQRRSLMTDKFKISLVAKKNPVQLVAFDILYFEGQDLTCKPLMERKDKLAKAVTEGHNMSISRWIEKNGIAFFELAKKENLEGIVAKKKDGQYHIGKRTSDWIKIKVMKDEDVCICGYQLDDNGNVKDLILGYYNDDGMLNCRGKVFLGVSNEERKIIKDFAIKNTLESPFFDKYKNVIWIKPKLIGTVEYMQDTNLGGMRQPVWKGLKVFL